MHDCCCFCPGWYYYMDCNGDFWVPYEVPVDSLDCGGECWCWGDCRSDPNPTAANEDTGPASLT